MTHDCQNFLDDDKMTGIPNQDSLILLVEDDFDDANLIQRIINRVPIHVDMEVCGNGQEALDLLEASHASTKGRMPDLILLDLNMPIMDGNEFMRALRSHPVLPTIPICVFSTSKDEDVVKAAYENGANVVVNKVESLEGMRKVIETIVNFWFTTAQQYYVE